MSFRRSRKQMRILAPTMPEEELLNGHDIEIRGSSAWVVCFLVAQLSYKKLSIKKAALGQLQMLRRHIADPLPSMTSSGEGLSECRMLVEHGDCIHIRQDIARMVNSHGKLWRTSAVALASFLWREPSRRCGASALWLFQVFWQAIDTLDAHITRGD